RSFANSWRTPSDRRGKRGGSDPPEGGGGGGGGGGREGKRGGAGVAPFWRGGGGKWAEPGGGRGSVPSMRARWAPQTVCGRRGRLRAQRGWGGEAISRGRCGERESPRGGTRVFQEGLSPITRDDERSGGYELRNGLIAGRKLVAWEGAETRRLDTAAAMPAIR